MANFINSLDHVRIAAPCSADWDRMFAFDGERVRFCSQCNLNVYNLSGMTRSAAEALITKTEGRLCVRFYRRSDGSILTQNCPVGLSAIKRRVAWMAQALLGMVVSFLSFIGLYNITSVRKLSNALESQHVIMGRLAYPAEQQLKSKSSPKAPTTKAVQGEIVFSNSDRNSKNKTEQIRK